MIAKRKSKDRPLSVPLAPEDALRGFMEVDPEAVERAERKEKAKRKRRRKKRKAKDS